MRLLILLALTAGAASAQVSLTESTIEAADTVGFVMFSDDSEVLIVGTGSGLEFFEVGSGDSVELRASPLFDQPLESAPGIPLRVHGLQSGDVLLEIPSGQVSRPRVVAVSSDGRLFALSNNVTREVSVLETGSGQTRFRFPSGLGAVSQVRFSPDGELLVIAYGDADIYVWDLTDGRLVQVVDELDLMTGSIKFSSDGSMLYTGGVDRLVRIWDTRSWRELRRFQTRHPETISDLHVSADERYVLTAGFDAATVLNPAHVVLWDAAAGEELARIRLPNEPASVSLSPDGASIAVAEGSTSRVRVWGVRH